MKVKQLQTSYLYEGLDRSESTSMLLWESAGYKLKEAALTADQIQQLFKSIESSATAAGDNRTALGKGKDAAAAVNKAWEDLKTKMQNSGPIKGFDQKVSDVLSKIGMGAAEPEFNGKVNKWVQKYRDFAKQHPIAQGAIYATLIALAGITGAGIGGAAALGLLKLADQVLQGKRFSSAAYAGVKAGAMAFAASKIGDYIKGLVKGDQVPAPGGAAGELPPGAPKMDFEKFDYYVGDSNNIVAVPKGAPNPFTGDVGSSISGTGVIGDINNNPLASPGMKQLAAKIAKGEIPTPQDMSMLDKLEASAVRMADMTNATGTSGIGRAGAELTLNTGEKVSGNAAAQLANRYFDDIQILRNKAIELAGNAKYGTESIVRRNKKLSEGQIYMVFNRVVDRNNYMLSEGKLNEGPLDAIKGMAGKAMNWAATKGKNLTTKVTADKLNSAWKSAGSPTDSDAVADFLKQQGVADTVISSVYQELKLPSPGSAQAAQEFENVKKSLASLSPEDKQKLLDQLLKAA